MRTWPHEYPPTELSLIPEGPAGIRITLDRMVEIVRDYRRNPTIRQLAIELMPEDRYPNRREQARAVWKFVRSYIRFIGDIRGTETLQTPIRTLQNRAGDCDDQSILVSALLEAVSHQTRFVAMGFERGKFSHVLSEDWMGRTWLPLETTVADVPFGWSPPRPVELMEAHV